MCRFKIIYGFREIESQKSAAVKLTALALLVLIMVNTKVLIVHDHIALYPFQLAVFSVVLFYAAQTMQFGQH